MVVCQGTLGGNARRAPSHFAGLASLAIVATCVSLAGTAAAAEAQPAAATTNTTNDRPPIDAPKVSFDEAIKRAMERNPNAELAMEEIKRSQALYEQVRASWLPTLNANATYTHLDGDRVVNGAVFAAQDQLNGNLQLTVPLLSAKNWANSARAKENVQYAKLSSTDQKRQVAIAAGRAYLTVIAQHRVLESSVRARDTARAHEEYAKSRFTGGIGTRLDAARASQERAASETRVQTQTLALERAEEALGVLLGESGPIDVVDAVLPETPSLQAAIGEAEKNRMDVVAQRERVEISRRSVRDNYADYLPVLNAVAQPFFQTPATPTQPKTGWQVQLILQIPLYDGGLRYGLAHEREALRDQSRTKLDALLRQVRSDVRTSFEAVQRADAALDQAREAARLAEESLSLAQTAYKAGATTNIEVIDAERRALDATTDAAVAEDAARQARLDLLYSSGRFPSP